MGTACCIDDGGAVTWYFHGFDGAIGNPPFHGGDDDDREGVVAYERTENGITYIVCGSRRYEVTARGNLRYIGDEPAPAPAPLSWWRRLWAWVQSWL